MQGHAIGNHSYSHTNGWKVKTQAYVRDVLRGKQVIQEYTGIKTQLFRPPYGRISQRQADLIRKKEKIVMMDILSGDFDTDLTGESCFRNVSRHAKPGSIILFHDSVKAQSRLEYSLPKTLEFLKENGYKFKSLPVY